MGRGCRWAALKGIGGGAGGGGGSAEERRSITRNARAGSLAKNIGRKTRHLGFFCREG